MADARLILHLPERFHSDFRHHPHLALYPRIEAAMQGYGVPLHLAPRPSAALKGKPLTGDGDLHIVESGMARGPGWLNGALAYLTGFWHLDPEGVLADSSLRLRRFDPAEVDRDDAERFLKDLQARFVAKRRSRYRQDWRHRTLAEGCIAVFLQGEVPFVRRQAYFSSEEMIRAAVEGSAGRPVVVKPHPLAPEFCAQAIAAAKADGLQFQVSHANVHDILAQAAVTVSVNSAVAMEGFLHGVPAILFGLADFAQFAQTVTEPDGFAAALQATLMQEQDFAGILWWYFARGCLNIDAPDFDRRLLDLFRAQGFDLDRFARS